MMKLSLEKKIVILITLIGVILSGTCICVSAAVNRSTMKDEYMITANSMSATVAVTVDVNQMARITQKVMEAYQNYNQDFSYAELKNGLKIYPEELKFLQYDEDYLAIQKYIRAIQDVSEADCIYTLYLCPETKTAVYIVDAAYEGENVPPCCVDMLEESCYPYLEDLNQGLPAFITNTPEYGWVVTAGTPVYDRDGNIVCLAMVDLSMNDVLLQENKFLYVLIFILTILTGMICIVAIAYVKRRIVKPINMLSDAARRYSLKQGKGIQSEFSSLKIHTGDELEILLGSMIHMEKDIDGYIKSLTQTKAQLYTARKQANNMQELAHMDSLTGIRNRLAYDKSVTKLDSEIQKGFSAFGIAMIDLNFLKSINDTYGHECGNNAIIALSRLVCEIFPCSPVFRIGGDEFVVILKNEDYQEAEQRIQTFNKQLEDFQANDALQPWEKISAALGYSLFNQEHDHCVEDVFKQADQNMYQRKKDMKAMRI